MVAEVHTRSIAQENPPTIFILIPVKEAKREVPPLSSFSFSTGPWKAYTSHPP